MILISLYQFDMWRIKSSSGIYLLRVVMRLYLQLIVVIAMIEIISGQLANYGIRFI